MIGSADLIEGIRHLHLPNKIMHVDAQTSTSNVIITLDNVISNFRLGHLSSSRLALYIMIFSSLL